MKRIPKSFLAPLFVISLIFCLVACSDSNSSKDKQVIAGTYQGKAPAYNKEILVSVDLGDKGEIKKVNVDQEEETKDIGTVAIEKIPTAIVESQSLDIDSISGATITSQAIVDAVANALKEAGVDLAKYKYFTENKQEEKSKLDYTIDRKTLPAKKEKTTSITLTDARGRKVEIGLPISSYAISTMDVIDYIIPLKGEQAFDMLVGSGQDGGHGFNKYAELYVPVVGNYLKHTGQISEHNAPFDLEMLLSMKPDVLIVNSAMGAHRYAMEIEDQLAANGTKLVLIDVPGKDLQHSVQDTMKILGQVFQEEDRAKEVSDFMDRQYQKIQAKGIETRSQKPSVYYEKSGYSEIYGPTATSKTGWGQVISLAGGANIADAILADKPAGKGSNNTLDPEYVLASDPDYIIISGVNDGWLDSIEKKSPPVFDIINRNGWKDLKAIKNKNLYEFTHSTSRSIYSFYPTLKMAKIFYPEDFSDLDPEAELKDFFDQFMLLDPSISTWSYSLKDMK